MMCRVFLVLCAQLIAFANAYSLSSHRLSTSVRSTGCNVLRRSLQPSAAAGATGRGVVMSEAATYDPFLRIGHGYDIHRLAGREEAGQPLVVGGVAFDGTDAPDYELGCVAHSDGDVIYHSVVDAILGALSMPDIGQLFPDNDPRLKGADSEIFMVEACKRMAERGYAIGNCDVTLILQKPKVNVEHNGRHVKGLMAANLVRLLHTSAGQVNVKARTHEKLDSVGEGRAVECHVVVTLEKVPS